MRLIFIILIACISYTSLLSKQFVVAIDTWKPFTYFENNTPKGITIDAYNKIAKELNYDIKFIKVPWDRALEKLKNGEIDALGNLSYTKAREKFTYYFKQPYYKQEVLFYTKRGNEKIIKRYEDLYNHTIVVGKNYAYYPKFDADKKIKKEYITKRLRGKVISVEEIMLKMLIKNRVAVVISSSAIMKHRINKLGIKKLINMTYFKPHANDFIYVGISRKSPFMKDIKRINRAINKIFKNVSNK